MAQLPMRISTTVPIGNVKKPRTSPPPPPPSLRFGSHHLSLPFCRGSVSRERSASASAPVSATSSPNSASRERFSMCFSLKHYSPPPPRVSTHLPLSISEAKSTLSLPPGVMELGCRNIDRVDSDDNARGNQADNEAEELKLDVPKLSAAACTGEIQPAAFVDDTESKPAVEDMEIDSEIQNVVSEAEKSNRDFEQEIAYASVFGSRTNISDGLREVEIISVINDVAKNSNVSSDEFERDFFKPSLLYGTDIEKSFMEFMSSLKKRDPVDYLEPYRSSSHHPIKKEGLVVAALLRSHLFVTRKIKNGANWIRILRRDKHKTKKKVGAIVRANVVDPAGVEKLWSRPILRGKRCRELTIEEFP